MKSRSIPSSIIIFGTIRFLAKVFGLYALIYLNFDASKIITYTLMAAGSEIYSLGAAAIAHRYPRASSAIYSVTAVLDAFTLTYLMKLLGTVDSTVVLYGFIVIVVAALPGGIWACSIAGATLSIMYLILSYGYHDISNHTAIMIPFFAIGGMITGFVDRQRILAMREKDEILERSTKQKEVNRLKNEFIAIASHNMRTPVTVLKACLEVLMIDKNGSDEQKENHDILKNMSDNVIKLNKLTDDFLNIASLEDDKFKLATESSDIVGVVNKAVKLVNNYAQQNRIEIEVLAPTHKLPTVDLDVEKISEALANIIHNAVKFSKEGQKVTVICSQDVEEVVVSVEDKGVGISKDEQASLFQKFHRGTSTMTYDYEGVGLGLYITKLIIEAHGGKISVESELGKGSVFRISLPQTTVGNLIESL